MACGIQILGLKYCSFYTTVNEIHETSSRAIAKENYDSVFQWKDKHSLCTSVSPFCSESNFAGGITNMALWGFTAPLQFKNCDVFGKGSLKIIPVHGRIVQMKPQVIEARARTRVESPKVRNRRLQKKYNGTEKKPRLSVFCSEKQLYAMLVDDQNKKCLFYGSTLQQSVHESPTCTTIEAAQHVGEELVKACTDLGIDEISSYDRNGFSRGARMEAFEIALSGHGFLFR